MLPARSTTSVTDECSGAAMRLTIRAVQQPAASALFDGIRYSHTITKGQNLDTAWYSILNSE